MPEPSCPASSAVVSPTAAATDAGRPWLLYLLECRGGRLYAGISPDVEARFAAHCAGSGAKFTRAHPPLRILAVEPHGSRSAASIAEYRLKRLPREGKLAWAQTRGWPIAITELPPGSPVRRKSARGSTAAIRPAPA